MLTSLASFTKHKSQQLCFFTHQSRTQAFVSLYTVFVIVKMCSQFSCIYTLSNIGPSSHYEPIMLGLNLRYSANLRCVHVARKQVLYCVAWLFNVVQIQHKCVYKEITIMEKNDHACNCLLTGQNVHTLLAETKFRKIYLHINR